jgi:5-methylcytosine-specific restriction protein A
MKKTICAYVGCNELVDSGYCPKHTSTRVPFAGATKSNAVLYNTRRWRTLRRHHLADNPRCVLCGSADNLTVDHVVPPRGNEDSFYDPNNLQTLCTNCHRVKTNQEIRRRR